jgi:hypothetical protein
MLELGKYAEDGAKLMIKEKWLNSLHKHVPVLN